MRSKFIFIISLPARLPGSICILDSIMVRLSFIKSDYKTVILPGTIFEEKNTVTSKLLHEFCIID